MWIILEAYKVFYLFEKLVVIFGFRQPSDNEGVLRSVLFVFHVLVDFIVSALDVK